MTTIVWDGHILAADRRMVVGDFATIATPKIFRTDDGRLAGAAGFGPVLAIWESWVRDGGERPAVLSGEDWTQGIEIMPDGKLYHHGQHGRCGIAATKHAIGPGCQFAMGAMKMGATAIVALEVASDLDPYTGSGIDFLVLGKSEPARR